MQDIPPIQYHKAALPSSFCVASIVKNASKNDADTYANLPCTEEEKAIIAEIITTMAEYGKLSLLLKQSHLKKIGAKINHVHPLKFLSTIIGDPKLKKYLNEIFDDYFKRNGFMDGVGPSLSKQSNKGKLDQYISDFALDLKVPPEKLRQFFRYQDWEGLVRYLMQ